MPAALLALAAIQTGFSIYSQQQQVQAANRATKKSARDEVANRNRIIQEGAERRSRANTILGGGALASAQGASQQGTILTSTNEKRSLLG